MEQSANALLQKLPSVDALLQSPGLQALLVQYGHNPVRDAARAELNHWRLALSTINDNNNTNADTNSDTHSVVSINTKADTAAAVKLLRQCESEDFLALLCGNIGAALQQRFASSLQPVFNLTGTVIHTNLGRALLPESAINAMTSAASQAVTLEYDLQQGQRGDRDVHVEALICELTGAEAATVVNNNAAAVLLILHSLAQGREVILSRGELVEIGGSFRIPEVMQSAGAILKEVGTTNRTHDKDYSNAINANTALLMAVHTSNYAIHGFTSAVPMSVLAGIAQQHRLPLVADLGSGTLLDMRQFGLPRELTAREVLEQGAELVCFSGDKLLGGPQAGIIAGKKELILRIKQNPLKRALRLDKIMIAALAAVLRLYLDPQRLPARLPVLRDLTRSLTEITALGELLLPPVQRALAGIAEVTLGDCQSQIGSGAMPEDLLPSKGLFIKPLASKSLEGKSPKERSGKEKDLNKKDLNKNDLNKIDSKEKDEPVSLQHLIDKFRALPTPVIGRIQDGMLVLDLRCLNDSERFVAQL